MGDMYALSLPGAELVSEVRPLLADAWAMAARYDQTLGRLYASGQALGPDTLWQTVRVVEADLDVLGSRARALQARAAALRRALTRAAREGERPELTGDGAA